MKLDLDGDSDVGHIVMLVTLKSVTNIVNRSSTHLVSNIRHQHQCNHLDLELKIFEQFTLNSHPHSIDQKQHPYTNSPQQPFLAHNLYKPFDSRLPIQNLHFDPFLPQSKQHQQPVNYLKTKFTIIGALEGQIPVIMRFLTIASSCSE